MARMHSRKKGKSGSKKPLNDKAPNWERYEKKEVELLIVKLAKEGKTSAQIGTILRDSYGIPNAKQITKNSITKTLAENKVSTKLPEDMIALIKREIIILNHLEENKHDQPSKRGAQLTESKIKRLAKYYKKHNRIPQTWRFSRENIKLLLE